MKNKKNLMLRLTLVSFALNIVSIFLTVLNHTDEKTAEIEKITYRKHKTLIDTGNFISAHGPLVEDFRNIVT